MMVLRRLYYLVQGFLIVVIMLVKGSLAIAGYTKAITIYISRICLENFLHQHLGFTSQNELSQQNYANGGYNCTVRESKSNVFENKYENILDCPSRANAVHVVTIVQDYLESIRYEILRVVAMISDRFALFTTNPSSPKYNHSVSEGTACENNNVGAVDINNAPEIVQEECFADQLQTSDCQFIVEENDKCDVLIKPPTNHELARGFLSPELEQHQHTFGTSPTRELFRQSRWKNLLHAPKLPEHYISKKWSKVLVALREHHLLKDKPEDTVRNAKPAASVFGQSPEVNGLLCMFPSVKHRFNHSNE